MTMVAHRSAYWRQIERHLPETWDRFHGDLAKEHSGLQMLAIHSKAWDLELLHAVTRLFPNLRRLRLTYDVRKPSKPWDHVDYSRSQSSMDYYPMEEHTFDYGTGTRFPDEVRMAASGNSRIHSQDAVLGHDS